jgi:hypothetical protein
MLLTFRKRRSFTCIFQVVESHLVFLLIPWLTQIFRVYNLVWWNDMQVIHPSFKLWGIWKRWSDINLIKIYGMWYRESVMWKRLIWFICNIQLKHKYLTLRMQELKRAIRRLSIFRWLFLKISIKDFLWFLIKLFACLIPSYCFLLLLINLLIIYG